MEEQTRLNKEIGTREPEKLKPEEVEIVNIELRSVEKAGEKLVCSIKHPAKSDPIEISSVSYLKADNIKISGLWFKEDEDENLAKNSALAILLNFLGCKTALELIGKKVKTREDSKGYLCFKAY